MNRSILDAIRDLIQEDAGNRGLGADPAANLITACPIDLHMACRSVAEKTRAGLAVVTGFFVPHATPPCGETDGPLGALFLARALVPLGIRVVLVTDQFCRYALEVGLRAAGLLDRVPLCPLPPAGAEWEALQRTAMLRLLREFDVTHLLALERVGPSHTPGSLATQRSASSTTLAQFTSEVSPDHHDRCHTARGIDITDHMSPAHRLFEMGALQKPPLTTIGIGDGGNEIGMGKIPWDVICRNIPRGGLIACRVPTDYLIVSGVSNWGAYGLATGIRILRGQAYDPDLYNLERERELLQIMVERGPLVDGTSGQPTVTVDGLSFERYAEPLQRMGELSSARR